MKMKRTLNAKRINNINKILPLMKSKRKEEKSKPCKEWINGISKSPNNNTLNINFRNQYAYNGYRESKIDLCKSFYYLII